MADYSDLPDPEAGLHLVRLNGHQSIDPAEQLMSPGLVHCHPYTHERLRTFREYDEARQLDPHVAYTRLSWDEHCVRASTVHLVTDMGWGENLGVFWETMIFGDTNRIAIGNDLGHFQARYRSEGEAVFGHRILVRAITDVLVKAGDVVHTQETPVDESIRERVAAYPRPELME
jgi:hypothetical protein